MGKSKGRKGMSQKIMTREATKILDSKDTMIKGVNKFAWKVRSRTDPNKWHTVKMNESGLECSCDYCQKRKKARCAHGKAIEMLILQNAFQIKPDDKEVVVDDDKIQVRCPNGHTEHIVFNGYRDRVYREPAHIRMCNTCDCSFTWDPGFVGRHYPPDVVLLALWLFYTGTSPTTAVTIIKNNKNILVHEITIERWAKLYTSLVELYTGDLPIRTGGIWSVDEKLLSLIKKLQTREKKMYLVAAYWTSLRGLSWRFASLLKKTITTQTSCSRQQLSAPGAHLQYSKATCCPHFHTRAKPYFTRGMDPVRSTGATATCAVNTKRPTDRSAPTVRLTA